jgi:hypothetical protein
MTAASRHTVWRVRGFVVVIASDGGGGVVIMRAAAVPTSSETAQRNIFVTRWTQRRT